MTMRHFQDFEKKNSSKGIATSFIYNKMTYTDIIMS